MRAALTRAFHAVTRSLSLDHAFGRPHLPATAACLVPIPPARRQAEHVNNQRPDKRRHVRERYHRIVAYPLFVLSLGFLVGFLMTLDPQSDPAYDQVAKWLVSVGWLAFLVDYFVGLHLAARRSIYMRTHILQAVAVLIPPMRVLLIGQAFKTMSAGAKNKFGGKVRLYALYLTTLTVVCAAVLEVFFERPDPRSNIKSVGDALWWASETISTVGYGDFYPVTIQGRVVAVILFVNGIALLSVVTATIAARVIGDDEASSLIGVSSRDKAGKGQGITLAELSDRLESIESELRKLSTSSSVQLPEADDAH
jgi:voltage-gated potassium channel